MVISIGGGGGGWGGGAKNCKDLNMHPYMLFSNELFPDVKQKMYTYWGKNCQFHITRGEKILLNMHEKQNMVLLSGYDLPK